MIPNFNSHGNLKPGVHPCSWEEFEGKFGYNILRECLIRGMRDAMNDLKAAGCSQVFIDGSFVTKKVSPEDYDACWDTTGVDYNLLDDVFSETPIVQKRMVQGEWYPINAKNVHTHAMLNYFQRDKEGNPKGIIRINLGDYDDKE